MCLLIFTEALTRYSLDRHGQGSKSAGMYSRRARDIFISGAHAAGLGKLVCCQYFAELERLRMGTLNSEGGHKS